MDDGDELTPEEDHLHLPEMTELVPCYLFDCAECGTENVVRAVTRFLDPARPEDNHEMLRFMNNEDYEHACSMRAEKQWYRVVCTSNPRMVRCKYCEDEFIAIVAGHAPSDELEDTEDE